ncbi:MAG TPA: M3 family metallopeptidase [Vicinamibacterales bacterium]|nr:M3 family metallopeptidase [Vicinamibacterales bacterium]
MKEWNTPFGVPPFAEIKPEHFVPAFTVAAAEQRREIDAIAANTEPATFANTIESLDSVGGLLSKVSGVFNNLISAETNEHLQAANREVVPMLSKLRDDVNLNPKLWARVKTVWEQREALNLTPVQRKLLDDVYKGFVRSGANLPPELQQQLRTINAELSMLGVKFSENLLHDTNDWKLVIDKPEDLQGLPESVKAAGAEAAGRAGLEGKWVYTLQVPSMTPFLQYADNRDLRGRIFSAYVSRCDHNDEYDNKKIVSRTAALRARRAQLLGYKTYADFVLEENMAKTPQRVSALLSQLWTPARAVAASEAAAMQKMIRAEGKTFTLAAWDWAYYTEKVRRSRYDLDDQALRPFFELANVRQGAFYVANQLYGITFTPRPDLPVYHPEVKAFEVKEADGTHVGIFYSDYFPRPGKRVGAWSSRYREQRTKDGRRVVSPVTVNVANFSRPAGDMPALLSIDETQTMFHELGHALNSLFSRAPYRGLRGPRDAGELPSQIMENWALEPEVLKVYAKHYRTGDPIPAALVEKLQASAQFNQGFATVEYLAAAMLDLDWHTLTTTVEQDAALFEKASMTNIAMPLDIVPRYRSPYYNHVFGPGGGYAAGYYNYVWSEVLDADAFQAFKEKGLFDPATAKAFRTHILESTGTDDAMTLYKRFRGREPSVEPLLLRRGLKAKSTTD